MSHEFETGAFVKQAAWHGLGNVLEIAPETPQEMLEASGLNWNIEKRPLWFEAGDSVLAVPDQYVLVRDSDDSPFGIVGKTYQPLQNAEALDWAAPLIDSGYWSYETAGALREGKTCWFLLSQGEHEVMPGDSLREFLLVNWTHDGKRSIVIQPTSVRVVCQNTLSASLASNVDRATIRHTVNMSMKMEEVRQIYEASTKAFAKQHEGFKVLADCIWKENQMKNYVDSLFGSEKENASLTGKGKTIAEDNRNEALEYVLKGKASGAEITQGTAWGAFSGVSEFVEHSLGKGRIKDRGENILYGRGADLLQTAFDTAMEMALS